MKDYIVSARKYRPVSFDTVAGQKALTTTLKNAIHTGKLAHAYLFCGPRGVGKTTCARIFAKTINCLNPKPNGEACEECESCRAFNEQRSLNIHELDAASNNSVDEIRSLIEKVRIPPQIGHYKVFIIDEVHMLSTSAFNAFLKTLEEPPAYVIFILATTEKHKILPTILSRCQVYDFNRINIQTITEYLSYVATQEGYTCEPAALDLIAHKADGGMRDALSIFDQAISYCGNNLTYERLAQTLNVLDYEYYFRLIDCFTASQTTECLLIYNEILNKGFDGSHFIDGLATHLRNLLVSHDPTTLTLLETTDDVRARYQKQAANIPIRFLYKAIQLANEYSLNYRASRNKRLHVELLLIQLSQLNDNEDQPSSGLRPEKELKPIFNKQTQTKTNPSTNKTQPEHTTDTTTHTTTTTQQPTNHTSPLPSPQDNTRKTPLPRLNTLGTSINKLKQDITNNPTPQATTHTTKQNQTQQTDNPPLTEDELLVSWHRFIEQLPREHTANAQRMKTMTPKLTNNNTFEVLVENEQVKIFIDQLVPDTQKFLRKELNNNTITMNVRIAQPKDPVRYLTKTEIFQTFEQNNPAIRKLTETFNLEIV